MKKNNETFLMKEEDMIPQKKEESSNSEENNFISENDLELENYSITVTDDSDYSSSTSEGTRKRGKKSKRKRKIELAASPINLKIMKLLIEENREILNKLNKNLFEYMYNMKQINKTKDINDIIRKIEHEEIKELVVTNNKLLLNEIQNIYNILYNLFSNNSIENGKYVDISKKNPFHNFVLKDNEKSLKKIEKKTVIDVIKESSNNLRKYKKLYKRQKKENILLRKLVFNIIRKNMKKENIQKFIFENKGIMDKKIFKAKKNNVLQNLTLSENFRGNNLFKKHLQKKQLQRNKIKTEIKKIKQLQPYLKKNKLTSMSILNKKHLYKKWKGICHKFNIHTYNPTHIHHTHTST